MDFLCPICKSVHTRLVWKEKQFRAYRCENCRVVFLHPLPQEPSAIYNEDYFRRWYIRYYSERKRYTERLFSKIEKYTGTKGKLLDVGCGTGILMEVAKERGWKVYGQEISTFAVEYCRGKGFEVYDKPLPELNLPENSFDLITLFDVIAHIEDPVSCISVCSKLLKPGGHLVIKTPEHPPYLFLLANLLSFTGKSRALLHIPAQIFHFLPESLISLLAPSGFTLDRTIEIRDFSLLYNITLSNIISKCLGTEDSLLSVWRINETVGNNSGF
jgi:2-polyprenyl-3-methyl-5-hydroxy-6-metoxy-1,4-benzoquinol methylase